MKRLFGNAILLIATLLFLSNCAFLQNLVGQYQPQTYAFNYDGKDYFVLLPKLVPLPPENAEVTPQSFYSVHINHIQYEAGEQPYPNLPVASFWFTEKLGVFGLVWHSLEPDGSVKHTPFLVVKGFYISTSVDDFNTFLDKLYQKIFEPNNSI